MQLRIPTAVQEREGSNKWERGRPASVGHFHEESSPTHFIKVIFKLGQGTLPIPNACIPYLGPVLGKITLMTYTSFKWDIKKKKISFETEDIKIYEVNNTAVLSQGRPAFTIAHALKVGYFLIFKKLNLKEYKLVIFDYSCCQVMKKCPNHEDATRMMMKDRLSLHCF
jgi:hypothetical protein